VRLSSWYQKEDSEAAAAAAAAAAACRCRRRREGSRFPTDVAAAAEAGPRTFYRSFRELRNRPQEFQLQSGNQKGVGFLETGTRLF
jgi:hypothetical protein